MGKQMRVLVVGHSGQLGGAELGLVRYLASGSSAHVRVLVLEDGPLVAHLVDLGVEVVLPDGQGPWACLRAVVREVRRPHEITVSWTLRAATWVGLAERRDRHLLYLQDLVLGGYFRRAKVVLAMAWVLRRPGAVMVNSRATRHAMPRRLRRRARWVVHTPSGVRSGADQTGRPLDLTVLRPLYLGRITPWKGPELFIDACERVAAQDVDAVAAATMVGGSFFGEEEFRGTVERRARESGLAITVLDHQDDIESLFARSNVLLHTSLTPEPFGQVLVQAMAYGLLVVGPDRGGPLEIIRDADTGFLYEAGRVDSLADVLLSVRRDPSQAAAVAERGRWAVERFTDEQVVDRIDLALAEFLDGAPARAGTRW